MSDDGFITYAAVGTSLGLISHFLFEWPTWLAILTGVFGPAILAFMLLLFFLFVYRIVGD